MFELNYLFFVVKTTSSLNITEFRMNCFWLLGHIVSQLHAYNNDKVSMFRFYTLKDLKLNIKRK